MAKPFGFLESSYTVVFPMFNQCIRFGEGGGVRPTHSIQAIVRTKSLSWVSLQWNGTDPSFLRQPENVNQSSTWWDDGTYFSNSRELSIGEAIHRFQCSVCSGGAVSKISIYCLFSLCPPVFLSKVSEVFILCAFLFLYIPGEKHDIFGA